MSGKEKIATESTSRHDGACSIRNAEVGHVDEKCSCQSEGPEREKGEEDPCREEEQEIIPCIKKSCREGIVDE